MIGWAVDWLIVVLGIFLKDKILLFPGSVAHTAYPNRSVTNERGKSGTSGTVVLVGGQKFGVVPDAKEGTETMVPVQRLTRGKIIQSPAVKEERPSREKVSSATKKTAARPSSTLTHARTLRKRNWPWKFATNACFVRQKTRFSF